MGRLVGVCCVAARSPLVPQNVPLDANCYNAALVGCLNDLERFEQLRAEMRQAGIPANTATLVITTHVCESNNLFEQAFLMQRDVLNSASCCCCCRCRRCCRRRQCCCCCWW